MAIVLGPELDLFLREIGEDLRGKTILEEPYVDRKTILRALKEQNKVILALQQHILEMKDVEERMQEKLERMEEKVISLEKYSSKVDKMVPFVERLNENVNDHVGAIVQISTKLKENEQSLAAFETETKGARDSLSKLQKDLDNMPETICISSRQVTHSIIDEKMMDENCSEIPEEENTKKFLIDIIAERERHVLLQEKQLKGLEIMIDDMKLIQNKSIDEIKRSIGDLTDWKHAQSGVDLETIKMDLDSINAKNEDFQEMLHRKMSKEDVEIKLNRQFDDIVEHLQSALTTIENEEADFKSITDSLSKMCESLREKKADKAELVSLRKQFIENQLEGYGAKGGSTLDNESLRRQLSNYPTKDIVLKMIQHHYENSQMKHFQALVKHSIASQSDESDTNPDYIYNMSQLEVNDNDTTITEKHSFKNSPLTKAQETVSGNTQIEQGGRTPNDMDLNDNEQHLKRFPSSSVVTGVLSKVQNNCDKERNHNQEQNIAAFRNLPSRRPFTAPPKKTITELNNNKLAKKHSLPAILTSISKMRPRSKMKSNQRSHVSFIHKGSYQVINSGIGKSSEHFMSEPLSFRKNDRPNTSGSSSSEQYSKKKQGYRIRTSIE